MTKNDITLTLISKKLDELRLEYSQNVSVIADRYTEAHELKMQYDEIGAKIIELEQTALFLKGE